jgi:calcineurin-like phosphoesterase family protein
MFGLKELNQKLEKMSSIRVCADTHFGHNNMATHRGFHDSFYHDEQIVDNWNSIVNKRDTTYLLGDVTMEKRTNYDILSRLNGNIVVVLGNHDMKNHSRSLLDYVDHVAGSVTLQIGRTKCILTHIPIHPMEFNYGFKLNIHGHLHKLKVEDGIGNPDPRYICVSMEQIEYKPRTFEELLTSKFL